ncbi:organic solvent ABC transporter substrate-binding protein [Acetobacter malorum]|uniref:Organic solvent ABC transporter substrate-binding protein n=1 Tax=Acetobacter malorum TaxID=178901 RepID=A0A149UI35_9PROT|nr:MlaD family protein [Acetobacter malorum]KXV67436.1 organic solvent ABC transporter substrate-binding protein [Acetobacter malorum]
MIGRGRVGAGIFSGAVLAGTLAFALYARATQTAPGQDRYDLSARFVSANGLNRGADVDLAGVNVGRVSSVTLDPASQMAIVRFQLNSELKLPEDSTLTIGSSTLSSDNALIIEPGQSHTVVAPGTLMTHTIEPSSLEQQVSNYIFGGGNLGQ